MLKSIRLKNDDHLPKNIIMKAKEEYQKIAYLRRTELLNFLLGTMEQCGICRKELVGINQKTLRRYAMLCHSAKGGDTNTFTLRSSQTV